MSDHPAIPMVELNDEHAAYWEELMGAVEGVLRHGQFIGGPEVQAFEQEASAYLGVGHAIGCNSGTDALVLTLRALGVAPGDQVITSPFTFFATAESISAVGAVPVFADIEQDTFNIDVEQIAGLVTGRTRAIIPVHLFGQPAEMDQLMMVATEHELTVVEDVAQAFGARFGEAAVGTIGSAGTFSFFPSKTLGGVGDGGLVTTNDEGVADRCRMLGAHGSRRRYYHEEIGYNSRLDTIQAAVLRVKLRRIDDANKARQRVAEHYEARLAGVGGVVTPSTRPNRTHVFHQYTLRIADGRRDAVREALQARQIASMIYYPVPCHQLPVYADLDYRLPVTEKAAVEVLSLPISPAMPEGNVDRVADTVIEALRG